MYAQACVECFFATLTHEYCEAVCETIMEIYNEQSWYVPADPNDLQAILVADAVYCAFGLAAFHLFDEIDFNQWLTGTLIRQLKINHPNYKIIKHRIIWLVGTFTNNTLKYKCLNSAVGYINFGHLKDVGLSCG